jgi:uncharacterized protein YjbI with pentapeptide repeats
VTVERKCLGKIYFLAGKFQWDVDRRFREAIVAEGGALASKLSADVDLLVLGTAQGSPTRILDEQASKLGVSVLAELEFARALLPTREEAVELLRGSEVEHARFRSLVPYMLVDEHGVTVKSPDYRVDLHGADLRGCILNSMQLGIVDLDEADLREARLNNATLPPAVRGARFDGADLSLARFGALSDCSLRNATLTGATLPHERTRVLERVDLTDANLRGARSPFKHSLFHDCVAVRADFSECDFVCDGPQGTDLSDAKFQKSELSGSNFSGIELSRADFSGAELNEASFDGAQLSNAIFRGAHLGYASFVGARLEGADFTGAFVAGARFSSPEAVLGLDLEQMRRTGKPGPHTSELAKVSSEAERVVLSVSLALDEDTRVTLQIDTNYSGYGGIQATWSIQSEHRSRGGYVEGEGLGALMHALARRFSHGKLLPDSFQVKGTKSPLQGKALKRLVASAWCEVLGLDPAAVQPGPAQGASRKKKPSVETKPSSSEPTTSASPPSPRDWDDYRLDMTELRDLALTPDNRRLLALRSREGRATIEIHRLDLRGIERAIKLPGAPWRYAKSFALSPDGRFVAAGYRSVHLCEIATGRDVGVFKGHKQQVLAIAFSRDGAKLATASGENVRPGDWGARVWDTASFRQLAHMKHHTLASCVAFSPDGKQLAVGTQPNYSEPLEYRDTRLWDLETKEARGLEYYEERSPGYEALAFSPDGRWIVGAAHGAPLVLWDARTGAFVREIGNELGGRFLCFAQKGRFFVVAQSDLIVRDASSFEMVAHFPYEHAAPFGDDEHFALLRDGVLHVVSVLEHNVAPPLRSRVAPRFLRESPPIVLSERPLEGLSLAVVGDVVDPEARRPFEPGDFARRLERLGGAVVRHDEPFDVAVIGLQASRHEETLTNIVQRKTPILNGAMLAKRLVTPSPRPDLVDVFGALVRFARAAEARPDVEIVRGFLGTVHDSLLRHQAFGGNVASSLHGMWPRLPRALGVLWEMLGCYKVTWNESIGSRTVQGGIAPSPQLRRKPGEAFSYVHWPCEGCEHAVLEGLNDESAAVFLGDYEGPEVHLWSNRDPGSLTQLAPDFCSYLMLAVQHGGRPLWQLALARPDLLTEDERAVQDR